MKVCGCRWVQRDEEMCERDIIQFVQEKNKTTHRWWETFLCV